MRPRVLVTGFGPFPGAPENPTEALVRALARTKPEELGASALRAVVLPTDYRKSWPVLRRLYSTHDPQVVVHFGLSRGADRLRIEALARRAVDPGKPDAAGFAPRMGMARRSGPPELAAAFPTALVMTALCGAGFPAELSEDAGAYVCNATFYRSLQSAPAAGGRLVGFVHVPPHGVSGFTPGRLLQAADLILSTANSAWETSRRELASSREA